MIEMYMTWGLVAILFIIYLGICIIRYIEILEELDREKKLDE